MTAQPHGVNIGHGGKDGVRSTESECGVRSAECGVRSTEYGVRSTEYGVRSTEYGVRSTECGVRSTEYGVCQKIVYFSLIFDFKQTPRFPHYGGINVNFA